MKILSRSKLLIGTTLLCTTLSLMLSCSGCKSGKIPETEIIKITADSTQKPVSQNAASAMPHPPTQTDTTFKPILLSNIQDFSVKIPVDEYNVVRYILSFYDKKTRKLIKDVDLVQENPFHKMGLERRKEPYESVYYFLMPEGKDDKKSLAKFLPKETFNEIPDDFEMDRAISKIFVSTTAGKFVTISYELDWLPDAYSDEGEWDGPGYGVHYVVVYDSLGNKIYNRQFDGTSHMPSVSEDGKYLFTMACLSPEWDENIRYRFSIVNIKSDKVVFQELIENCKKHGGGGDYDDREIKRNSYVIRLQNNLLKKFMYLNNSFYLQKRFLNIDNVFPISNGNLEVWYLDGPNRIIDIDSFFYDVKLD